MLFFEIEIGINDNYIECKLDFSYLVQALRTYGIATFSSGINVDFKHFFTLKVIELDNLVKTAQLACSNSLGLPLLVNLFSLLTRSSFVCSLFQFLTQLAVQLLVTGLDILLIFLVNIKAHIVHFIDIIVITNSNQINIMQHK